MLDSSQEHPNKPTHHSGFLLNKPITNNRSPTIKPQKENQPCNIEGSVRSFSPFNCHKYAKMLLNDHIAQIVVTYLLRQAYPIGGV
ncbi:11453_t:CDS:1, partial [Racocetra fulgida]